MLCCSRLGFGRMDLAMSKKFMIFLLLMFPLIILWRYQGDAHTIPQMNNIMPTVLAVDGDHIVVASNRDRRSVFDNTVCLINSEGYIEKYAFIRSKFRNSQQRIARIERDNAGNVYFLASETEADGTKIYSVFKSDLELDNIRFVKAVSIDYRFKLKDFDVYEDQIYLIGISYEKNIESAQLIRASFDSESQEYFVDDEIEGDKLDGDLILDCIFDSRKMFLLDSEGHIWNYDVDSKEIELEEGIDNVSCIDAENGYMYYFKSRTGIVTYRDVITGEEKTIDYEDVFIDSTKNHDFYANLLMDTDTNKVYFTFRNAEGKKEIDELRIDFASYMKSRFSKTTAEYIKFVLIVSAIYLVMSYLTKRKSLTIKAMTSVVVINLIFASILGMLAWAFQIFTSERGRRWELEIYTSGVYTEILSAFTGEKIDFSTVESFRKSKFRENLTKDTFALLPRNENGIIYAADIVYVREDASIILYSEFDCAGMTVVKSYGPTVNEMLTKVVEEGKDFEIKIGVERYGKKQDIAITKIQPKEQQGEVEDLYLVTNVDTFDIDISNSNALPIKMVAIYTLIITLTMILVLYLSLYKINTLCHYMAVVAGGMYDLPDRIYPDNELGKMWVYLNSLCGALKVRNVARSQVLNYYVRFVPKGFERLFELNEMQELAAGKVRNITAAMAVIEAGYEKKIVSTADTRSYSKYQNSVFSVITDHADKKKGIVLANDGKAEMTRIIFSSVEKRAQSAFEFASGVMNTLEAKGLKNDCIFLLHEGVFSCGIVENSSQAYPFVKSEEIDFFYGCMKRLRKAGVRLVVTESMRQKMVFEESFRYIGYLQSDGSKKYRLYEDLNVCSKEIRDKKSRYDDIMQDAIIDFYHSDIASARDGFSRMVKLMPEDGIAIWYLFRCEELLQASDPTGSKALFCN